MFLRWTQMPFDYIILCVWVESYSGDHFTEINTKTKHSRYLKILYNSSRWGTEERDYMQLKLWTYLAWFQWAEVLTILGRGSWDFNMHKKFVVFITAYYKMSLPVNSSIRLLLIRTISFLFLLISVERTTRS